LHDPLSVRDLLADELDHRRQAGFDVSGLEARVAHAIAETPDDTAVLVALLVALEATTRAPGWPFTEVESAAELITLLDADPPIRRPVPTDHADRIHGAWLGRCAGCALGKPVEGWSASEIRGYLERVGAWPLDGYIPAADPHPADLPPMKPSWVESTRGAIQGMPRDDDLDYTVVGLLVLERTAGRPTPDDIAREWLGRLPIGQLFTAERAAYRNLVNGLRPPDTAAERNPYREWIGGLIRVDPYAYANPGDPIAAARLAATDASLSHVGNGVAAAMWGAALISLAAAGVPPRESVPAAMRVVPAGTRLRAVLELVVQLHRRGHGVDRARAELAAATSAYGWIHAIPNAAIIATSLLWGDGDFGRSITLAVMAGCDTDSNGATVGSAAGAYAGASRLPPSWADPLQDSLRTAVAGVGPARISQLAERTVRLAREPVAA
jgi:ADP-ribosylglycohydrolase